MAENSRESYLADQKRFASDQNLIYFAAASRKLIAGDYGQEGIEAGRHYQTDFLKSQLASKISNGLVEKGLKQGNPHPPGAYAMTNAALAMFDSATQAIPIGMLEKIVAEATGGEKFQFDFEIDEAIRNDSVEEMVKRVSSGKDKTDADKKIEAAYTLLMEQYLKVASIKIQEKYQTSKTNTIGIQTFKQREGEEKDKLPLAA